MLSNQGPHSLEIGSDGAQRRHLILADQATVAFDIGMQDRSQLAGDALWFHGRLPSRYWVSDRTLCEMRERCQSRNINSRFILCQSSLVLRQAQHERVFSTGCLLSPFALSVAASAAKSKSAIRAGVLAFDCAALRSGRTAMRTTASEAVYEGHVVCSEIRTQVIDFVMGGDARVMIG